MNKRELGGIKRSMSTILGRYESLLTLIVDRYLMAEVLAFNDDQIANKIRDLLNFCITKSCKSLIAIQLLLEFRFGEDCLIILRSIYENYLSIVYILKHPERIDDFIEKPLGVKFGSLIHPKQGQRTNFRKVLDPKTNEMFPYGISFSELAKGSLYESDFGLFQHLYSFLSEMVHPHFISSGSYRSEKTHYLYSYSSLVQIFNAKFLSVYLFTIILVEVFEIESDELEIQELSRMRKDVIKGYNISYSAINFLLHNNQIEKDIASSMLLRLEEIKKKKWFSNW
jgi:hypothetical protein